MSTRRILHFGLNRSGTNYLKEILDQHFDLEFLNVEGPRAHPLHKHFRLYNDKSLIGRPKFQNDLVFDTFSAYEKIALRDLEHPLPSGRGGDFAGTSGGGGKADEPDVAYVIISKDPYSWQLSYSRWGIKNKWSPSPHPYILEYNAFYDKWLEFAQETDRIAFVRYIDLLRDPEAQLRGLQEQFSFKNTRGISPEIRIKKVPMSGRFSKKRLKYYLDQAYLDEYSPGELSEMNRLVDHQVARKLGYELQGPVA